MRLDTPRRSKREGSEPFPLLWKCSFSLRGQCSVQSDNCGLPLIDHFDPTEVRPPLLGN